MGKEYKYSIKLKELKREFNKLPLNKMYDYDTVVARLIACIEALERRILKLEEEK